MGDEQLSHGRVSRKLTPLPLPGLHTAWTGCSPCPSATLSFLALLSFLQSCMDEPVNCLSLTLLLAEMTAGPTMPPQMLPATHPRRPGHPRSCLLPRLTSNCTLWAASDQGPRVSSHSLSASIYGC